MAHMKQSHGPIVYHNRDDSDGTSFRASCEWCCYRSWRDGDGHVCTFRQQTREIRPIPDIENTPDWCAMRAGMLEDAREMHDFERMGLDKMTRPELLAEVRLIRETFRPWPLSRTGAYVLRRALRAAWLAAETAGIEDEGRT